jgi:acyl-CoA thioesterase-1
MNRRHPKLLINGLNLNPVICKFVARVITIMVTAAIVSCSDNTQLQALDADATILAFGDSLTYGTGTSKDKAYPAVLERLINRKVVNAGIPGEISKNGLARLPGLLEKHHPRLIIICHGGNDIIRKLDLSLTRNNIQQMINLARQNNSEVMLIGVPEFGLFLNTVPIYQALADENHVPIANNILGDIIGNNSLKSDHIHPNTEGYQLLAENINVVLKQSGAISED